jgi:hypothetical protein
MSYNTSSLISPCGLHPLSRRHRRGIDHIVALAPVAMMEGALPEKQRRLVMAWAEIHQFELLSDWDLLQNGKAPVKIESFR